MAKKKKRQSQSRKSTRRNNPVIAPAAMGYSASSQEHDGLSQRINKLLRKRLFKPALTELKKLYDTKPTPRLESLVIQVYLSQIYDLYCSNLPIEAAALVTQIKTRYPERLNQIEQAHAAALIATGRIDAVIAPLANPALDREQREALEKLLKQHLLNPRLLAESSALPADHPLRVGAAAIVAAFTQAVTGPVDDNSIALPEISRRSPLAPWKLLIRAIALFYRGDDEGCLRTLEGLESSSAASLVKPVLKGLIAGEFRAETESERVLSKLLTGNNSSVTTALEDFNAALKVQGATKIIGKYKVLSGLIAQHYPELSPKLDLYFISASLLAELSPNDILKHIKQFKHSSFSTKALAIYYELQGQIVTAILMWYFFLEHAVYETWLQPNSELHAALYDHCADMVKRINKNELDRLRFSMPPEIPASLPHYLPPSYVNPGQATAHEIVNFCFYPEKLFERAAEICPDRYVYLGWLDWLDLTNAHWRDTEALLEKWSSAFPNDLDPLLLLVSEAQKRNAHKKALIYLAKAEKIDSLNPLVRKQQAVIAFGIARNHLEHEKFSLLQKDIATLQNLPAMKDADRPALILALQIAMGRICEDYAQELQERERELARLLGSNAAKEYLLNALLRATAWHKYAIEPATLGQPTDPGKTLAGSIASLVILAQEFNLFIDIPLKIEASIVKDVKANGQAIDLNRLKALGNYALTQFFPKLAYYVSAVGIRQISPLIGHFLLIRSDSLPPQGDSGKRGYDCLRAANYYARIYNDQGLLKQIAEWQQFDFPFGFMTKRPAQIELKATPDEVTAILALERQSDDYSRKKKPPPAAALPKPKASAPQTAGAQQKSFFDKFNMESDSNEPPDKKTADFIKKCEAFMDILPPRDKKKVKKLLDILNREGDSASFHKALDQFLNDLNL